MSMPHLDVEWRTVRPVPNGAKPNRSAHRLTPLSELLAAPVIKVTDVVDGMLSPGETSGWIGKPKTGKGTLVRNLGLSVSRAQPFLGRRTTLGGICLYCAFEDSPKRIAVHFRAMGASDEPIYVYAGPAPDKFISWLGFQIEEHSPALTLLDPIGRCLRIRDVNDYAEITAKTEPLIRLAAESGCHIAFVHHAGKVERGGGDDFLGSTALFGSVDTAVILRRDERGVRTLETVQRSGEDLPPTVLHLDPVSGLVTLGRSQASDALDQVKAEILTAIAGPTTEAALRKVVTSKLAVTALRQLVKEGKIRRSGDGRPGRPYLYEP